MCCPIYGMVHIKEPLLLIGKSSPFSGVSVFAVRVVLYYIPDAIITIKHVLSASLNKISHSDFRSEQIVI